MTVADPAAEELTEFPPEMLAPGSNPPALQAKVPFAMTTSTYVPKERYYERQFFDLENEHLWPNSWLMAARLEEIPRPGDYTEFEVAGSSILVIRQVDGSVKALHNACRHRATELAKGCGRLPGGQIVCPFHGWRWKLDGSSSFVFMDGTFDPTTMDPNDLRLRECNVELWAGMVWINMDPDAEPLNNALAPAQNILDHLGLTNMRVKWWKQVVLEANWKMTMEAFLESYHVMQTHPQLVLGKGDEFATRQAAAYAYTAFRGGHSRFFQAPDPGVSFGDLDAEDYIELARLSVIGQDAMVLDRDVQIMEGLRNKVSNDDPEFPMKAVQAIYEYAEGAGIPMPAISEYMKQWGGEVFIFPNSFFLPLYGNCLAYRMRPLDDEPERTIFDVWSLTTFPEGQAPERAELLGQFDKEDVEHWGLIPRQDFSNIERQQRGLHSRGLERLRLSSVFERNIANVHEEIDRVIASRL